jgi:hypothetical protein
MTTEKEYVFWVHYNQPESRKQKKPIMTVHYRNACNFVDNIHCDTVTFGFIKDRQPRWVIKGKTNNFQVVNGIGFIKNSNADVSDKGKSGYGFKFYYNKSESNRLGKPQINLIWRNETYIVDNIECNVPVWSETKKMYFTLNGRAKSMKIIDGIAHLD